MRVLDAFQIKGRGTAIYVGIDEGDRIEVGDVLRSGSLVWAVVGIESFATPRSTGGLLVERCEGTERDPESCDVLTVERVGR